MANQSDAVTPPPAPKPPRGRSAHGSWELVPLSGIIPGVVLAYTKSRMASTSWLVVTGAAYGFGILNKNFQFTWTQKIVATAIMLAIGTYWREALEFFRH